MDISKIEKLIKANKREIQKINDNSGEYASFSLEAKENAIAKIREQIAKLEALKTKFEKMSKDLTDLEQQRDNEKDPNKRKDINDKVKEARNKMKNDLRSENQKLNKPLQGKVTNIISSYIGQIDKRIHNRLYANNEKRWTNHEKNVKARYEKGGLLRYALIRAGIVAGMVALTTIAPAGTPIFVSALGSVAAGIVNAGTFIFGANALVKTLHTIYTKRKFGEPLLERERKVTKGGYLASVDKAFNEYDNAKSMVEGYGTVYYFEKGTVKRNTTSGPKAPETSNENEKLNDFIKELMNADLLDTKEENIKKLNELYIKGKPYFDKLPEDAKKQYEKIGEVIKKYFEKAKGAETIENDKVKGINDYLENITDDEINALSNEKLNNLVSLVNSINGNLSEKAKNNYDKVCERLKKLSDKKEKENVSSEASSKPIEETPTVENGEKEEKNTKNERIDAKVRNLIAKVGKIDPNNLDRDLIEDLIRELNSLTIEQRSQVPQGVYVILGKARNMCIAQNKNETERNAPVYENELNKLVERVNLDKIKNVLKSKSFSKLTQDDKRYLHDELIDIRNILNIVSSENVNNTSLDGKNIMKLNEIIKMFGTDNTKVNKAIPNKVIVEVSEVTDKTGRKLIRYSGNCKFYIDDDKAFERIISLDSDDNDYIEERIRKEVYGFNGEIEIKKAGKNL